MAPEAGGRFIRRDHEPVVPLRPDAGRRRGSGSRAVIADHVARAAGL